METPQSPRERENPTPTPPLPSTPTTPTSNATTLPYPTTFVQADTSSFKQVVQMLTGSAETAAMAAKNQIPPPPPPSTNKASGNGPKKPAFKLYERRSSLKNLKMISPLLPTILTPASASPPAAYSPRSQPEVLSPSILDFPSLVLSPVTPLIPDPFNRGASPRPGSAAAVLAEDRAIAEKGFYLHPSPRADAEPPRLLSLFPVTSPRGR